MKRANNSSNRSKSNHQRTIARKSTTTTVTTRRSSSEQRITFNNTPRIRIETQEEQLLYPPELTLHWNKSSERSSSLLPTWMQEYFAWHTLITQNTTLFNEENWVSGAFQPKLLILSCTLDRPNEACGGTADRLKPIPLVLLAAAESQRLFFIRWRNRPCRLEEFFVPPSSLDDSKQRSFVLDWRVPDWLEKVIPTLLSSSSTSKHVIDHRSLLKVVHHPQHSTKLLITTKLQWHDGGEKVYETETTTRTSTGSTTSTSTSTQGEFQRIYHELFHLLFHPTRPLQQALDNAMQSAGLQSGQYAVAHYRAYWWETQEPPNATEQIEVATNAVQCASQLINNVHTDKWPIYFASDSALAVQAIQTYATTQHHHRRVVTLPHSQLHHLDRVYNATYDATYHHDNNKNDSNNHDKNNNLTITTAATTTTTTTTNNNNNNNIHISELYPIFIDLLLMANAQCVTYGDGGFGRYGLMLSQNHTCSKRHIIRHQIQKCNVIK